jgi:alpha-ketoglutarate-dependent taurine dioxygenase
LPSILKVSKDGKLPLSFAQQRLWFLDQLEPGNPFYNIGRALRLKGKLDRVALSASLNQILLRHESLRTVFGADEGTPFQQIVGFNQFDTTEVDLRSLPGNKKEDAAAHEAAVEINRPFDLTTGPLLRARLIRLADDEHVLVLTMHHIAADEWSLAILFRELTALYELRAGGKDGTLSELPIQYADYAVWQRQWLQGEAEDNLVSYWRKQLQGAPTILNLPTDRPEATAPGFRGAYELLETSAAVRDGVRRLSQNNGATLFMTCLAAFQILLSRFTGQQDLLVGTDVANRNRVETEGLIGFFTNLLPLRGQLTNDLKFDGLLAQVREVTLEAYAHQDLPFAKLVEEIRPERAMGRNPLVQVLLVMQNPAAPVQLKDLEVSRYDLPLETSRFDLVLFLAEREEGLTGFWLYNADLFEAKTITGLSRNYEQLLAQIIEKPNARIDSFEILTKDTTTQAQARLMEKKDLKKTKTDRLKSIRRKSVDFSEASIVQTGPLKSGETLPLLLEPRNQDVDLAEWAEGNRSFIEEKLLQHGALLFRGFDLPIVPEFEKFASAICPELFGEYGDLPREELGGKVYGSTPYPSDERILFHNESSHMHQWPMLIWFYCVQPSLSGGESPVIDCRRIYQSLDPIIRTNFENEGLMYVRNFTDGLDVSWQDFFHTNDRNAVESYCRQAGIDFEWKGDNGLRTRQVGPAIVRHPQTGELVFFNQLQVHHISCLAAGVRESLLSMMSEEDLPRNVYYGDGSAIEDSVMEHIGDLYEKLSVSFQWERHDVLMLNNMLVAHSRNPYLGERKIVVALGNLVTKQ